MHMDTRFVKARALDIFEIRLGSDLAAQEDFVDKLCQTTAKMREQTFSSFGIAIPSVHITDDEWLSPREYAFFVSGCEVSRFNGEKNETAADVCMHFSEILVSHLPAVITTQYVEDLLCDMEAENETLVSHLRAYDGDYHAKIKQVLQALAADTVNVRDMVTVLETLNDTGLDSAVPVLVQKVRLALAPHIVRAYIKDGTLAYMQLSEQLLVYMAEHIDATSGEIIFDSPDYQQKFISALVKSCLLFQEKDMTPLLVCPDTLWQHVSMLTHQELPIPVLSGEEVLKARNILNFTAELVSTVDVTFPKAKSAAKKKHVEAKLYGQMQRCDVLIAEKAGCVVGLQYDQEKSDVPVVALLHNDVHLVRHLSARQHAQIPIVYKNALARNLYATLKVGSRIQDDQIKPVATVYTQIDYLGKRAGQK